MYRNAVNHPHKVLPIVVSLTIENSSMAWNIYEAYCPKGGKLCRVSELES